MEIEDQEEDQLKYFKRVFDALRCIHVCDNLRKAEESKKLKQ
jgi:hypothetical protein